MDSAQLQDVLENIQNSTNKIIGQIQTEMENLEKAPELKTTKLPKRLSAAMKKSKQLKTDKEMLPNEKYLFQ